MVRSIEHIEEHSDNKGSRPRGPAHQLIGSRRIMQSSVGLLILDSSDCLCYRKMNVAFEFAPVPGELNGCYFSSG